jgi:hypothetical protein
MKAVYHEPQFAKNRFRPNGRRLPKEARRPMGRPNGLLRRAEPTCGGCSNGAGREASCERASTLLADSRAFEGRGLRQSHARLRPNRKEGNIMYQSKCFRSRNVLFGAICASAVSAACSAYDPEAELGEVTEEVTVVASNSPSGFSAYTTSGVASRNMTATSNSTCFLTGAYSRFEHWGDRVEIVKNNLVSPEVWQLRKFSSKGAPGGQAYCASGVTPFWPSGSSGPQGVSPDMHGRISWDATINNAPIDLGTATSRTCFLTAVWGNYKATGEEVRTQIVGGRWQIMGNSAAGAATCVQRNSSFPKDLPASGGLRWFSDPPHTSGPLNPVPGAGTNAPWLCALTRVSGTLRVDGGVFVRQFQTLNTPPKLSWELESRPSTLFSFPLVTAPVSGSGRCIGI